MSSTIVLGTKRVKLPPKLPPTQEEQWLAVIRKDAPTWKVVLTSHDEETWKFSLHQWKGKWVHIDDQYEGLVDDPMVNFIVPTLPGELRVVYNSADQSVEATAIFTDENDDGPCLYFEDGVVVVVEACEDKEEDVETDEEDDDGFEDCDCGYTHHHEDKCPVGDQCRMYERWREEE